MSFPTIPNRSDQAQHEANTVDMSALEDQNDDMNITGGEEDMDVPMVDDQVGHESKLTSDGGVVKTLLTAGQGWQTPAQGNDVHVHYVGKLLDGTVFDSSRDRGEPFKFTLGKGQVIKGWDIGVKSMKKGETSLLTCKPEYAYGEQGAPPKIPANATLQFEVELLFWGTDLTHGKHGIMKTILKEGTGYEQPKDLWEVNVAYEAKVKGSTEPFSKSDESGTSFVVKDGHLCPAIAQAVKTMKLGELASLEVSPEFGFGSNDQDQVPANSSLEISLELKSWNKVESLTTDGGVVKKVLVEGEGYKKPSGGVKVKLTGYARLLDGTVIEEFPEGKELEFVTEEEQVVAGLDTAVMQMNKGEKAEITLTSPYAYGDEEVIRKVTIPSGSTIVYEICLVEFEKGKESWDMEESEKIEAASTLKDRGNVFFKDGKYKVALKKYEKALSYIEYDTAFSDENKSKSKELKKSLYLNDAAAKLRLSKHKECVQSCTKALELDASLVKAYFRRSQAYEHTVDYDLAEADLKKALELEGGNVEVKKRLANLKRKIASQNRKDAKLYGSIFKKLAKMSEREDAKTEGSEPVKTEPLSTMQTDLNKEDDVQPEQMETEATG